MVRMTKSEWKRESDVGRAFGFMCESMQTADVMGFYAYAALKLKL